MATTSSRRIRLLIGLGALTLTSTACGGLIEAAVENGVEEAIERGIEADSDGEDVEFDLDLDGGTAQIQVGDSQGVIGATTERPDWLDDKYVLPDELIIIAAITDAENGQTTVTGSVASPGADIIMAEGINMLEDAGYQMTPSSVTEALVAGVEGSLIEGVNDDGELALLFVMTINETVGSQYRLEIHAADSSQAISAVERAANG